jgi:hypothetical protein
MDGRVIETKDFLCYSSQITTEDGITYYCCPYWFRYSGDHDILEVYFHDLPEDLSQAITKSRLGGNNVKIMKSEELCKR